VNVAGTEHVIEAARRAGIDRFVYLSSEAVLFDGTAHHEVHEAAPIPNVLKPCTANRKRGRSKPS